MYGLKSVPLTFPNGFMRGLKLPPPSESSFSAAGEVVSQTQNLKLSGNFARGSSKPEQGYNTSATAVPIK
jgi:hypothetical protein